MNSSACEKPSARSTRILSAQKSLEYHKHKKIHHDSLSSRKACLSATSSSLRLLNCERRRSLDSIQNAAKGLCIEPKEFIPPKVPHHPCIFEDQKVFLQGSQMLEKLNQILKQNLQTNDDLLSPSSPSREFDAELFGQKFTKQNTKRLIFYYDQLKKLLIERCLLILKGQCSDHIFQSRKFLEESMSFALTERIKIKAIPSKARNPFIDSCHIDINNLYFLVEKLNATSDMWFSLVQNFQRIISLFHVGYDIQLHQLLCSTNIVLKNLLYKIFFWVRFNLDINIQKLCRSEPSTVSSEFLQSILDVCKAFNVLLVEKQQQGFGPFSYSKSILNFCSSNGYVAEMSSSNILNYLSRIESSIVAERIVRFVMSESQKELRISTKNKLTAKWIPKEFQHKYMQQDSSTSDYYSASASETENTLSDCLDKTYKVQMQPLEGLASSLASVISVLLQRNQALVLKYLFAVMCLNNSPSKTLKSGGFRGNVMQPSRALWKLPLQHYSNKTCTFLERVYWSHFWQQVEESIFKLMTEVSHHHYGDMLPGPIALWPDALLCAMMNILKQCIQDDEICKEAQQLMKHVYLYLFSTAAYISWDERFLIALSVTQSYQCPAVPVAEGLVCTNPGNLLCSAIEPLIGLLLITIPAEEYSYAIKALQQLQCSVNYLFLWSDVRKRAFLSSWNISSYLLVSCADTKQACLLLSYVKHLSLPNLNQVKKRTHSFITCQRMWKILCQQICDLKNSLQDVPPLIYQKTYELATDILKHSLPGSCIWSMCKKVNPSTKTYVQELIDTILLPVFDTVICLPNPMPVSNSVINAIAYAWLASLRNRKLKLSVNNAQQLHHDVCQIIAWIEQSNLHKKEKDCLKEMKSVQQLQSVAEWLSSLKPHSGPSCLIYNRVVPVGSEVEYSSQRLSNMLTETEKDNWRKIHSCSSSFLSRCIGCT